jgi:phospholipid/cholesterol/gamma-HCH transport system substrate-binding protein
MDDRVLRIRVGVVVLAAALITAFLVARFGDLPLPGGGTYTIFVRFPRAPGVTQGTPVRMSGVQIGRVTALELLQPTGVRVVAEIDRNRTILDSDACWITSASVLGDSVVEFVPPDTIPPGSQPLESGTEIINGRVGANPLESFSKLEPSLQDAMRSVREAGTEVAATARRLNNTIANNQDQLPRIAQKTERALDQFTLTMSNMNQMVGDEQMQREFQQALREFPALVQNFSRTLNRADGAFDSMKMASDRAVLNLDNLANFTKPLGERGPQLVDNLDGSLANINELLEQLVIFTDNLNSREGSLGRLMNDPAIYNRLDRTLANAEDITSRLKPIMDDIRIFSDKIARDPRQLGLKGALDRRPVGTGNKSATLSHGSHGSHEDQIIIDGHGYDPVVID